MAARDYQPLVDQMSDVQRRVFGAAREHADDEEAFSARLAEHNGDVVGKTLRNLAGHAGCSGSAVEIGEDLQAAIDEAALASAESVANTWNYDLSQEILDVGRATPTANYRTYRSRLFGDTPNSIYPGMANWATAHGWPKMRQIARTETGTAINLATELFFQRNPQLDGQAEVRPAAAKCPVCMDGVAGNPYPSVRAAYRANGWPAHPGCVHYVETIGRVMAEDCADVWKGA